MQDLNNVRGILWVMEDMNEFYLFLSLSLYIYIYIYIALFEYV